MLRTHDYKYTTLPQVQPASKDWCLRIQSLLQAEIDPTACLLTCVMLSSQGIKSEASKREEEGGHLTARAFRVHVRRAHVCGSGYPPGMRGREKHIRRMVAVGRELWGWEGGDKKADTERYV